MKKDLQQQIDETLNSLDGIQRAEGSPFLYSKLRNRMQSAKESVPQSLAWRMVAALVIVGVINAFTLLHFTNEKNTNAAGAASVASEYNISLPQTY